MKKNETHNSNEFITAFLNNPNELNMETLVTHFKTNDVTDSKILLLANGLANSGQKINLTKDIDIYDIPSSGGPGSLSTLLCPLFLAVAGKTILKLGVPGRPAGGIDVLAQIKGYNITPTTENISDWIMDGSKYIHFLASKNFTPLDAQLFKFRKENNAVAVPSLAIASLLSKKIAVGLSHLGLDVRVSAFGNFGKTWSEATNNAKRFNRIALLAGINSRCFLSNGNVPQQPYIGRGEAILALKRIFTGTTELALLKHVDVCFKMTSSLTNSDRYNVNDIYSCFLENIDKQCGSMSSFDEIAMNIEENHTAFIVASESGFIQINIEIIRDLIVQIQNDFSEIFPDPCGVILKVSANELVEKEDILCSFRCPTIYISKFKESLIKAFQFTNEKLLCHNDFEEIT